MSVPRSQLSTRSPRMLRMLRRKPPRAPACSNAIEHWRESTGQHRFCSSSSQATTESRRVGGPTRECRSSPVVSGGARCERTHRRYGYAARRRRARDRVVGKDVAIALRGFGRIRGGVGPLNLARDIDDAGDPAGYRLLTGPELLMDPHRQETVAELPPQFTFKRAR